MAGLTQGHGIGVGAGATAARKVRVLVVDDSALVRQLLSEILAGDPGIEVVGTATDPYAARDRIKQLNPDVLTLDVEMPRMDGLTFLRNLMRLRPMPVVMVSSLTTHGADVTLDALELGAVDYVPKPVLDLAHSLPEYAAELIAKVKQAARARVRPRAEYAAVPERLDVEAVLPAAPTRPLQTTDKLIAIGASTGGTEAIRAVLEQLPATAPAVVITQHIPEAFSLPFAQRLDRHSALAVKQAEDGDLILPGHAYVAPGSHHLLVVRDGARWRCRLSDASPVNRHRPSVDVMFRSVAQAAGGNAIGVLLTGMGADGAEGLGDMRAAGAATLAQDEASSVVWGMPGEAVARGCVDMIVPLNAVAGRVCVWFQRAGRTVGE
ncbi:MAG TPA: chemotaxis response regulator protein-glutamate methylesterase [Gammaproteobacteria bacterium]